MPFPNRVNITQAPGVEGDFASTNPRHSVLSGGGFVAGPNGVSIAHFAWIAADASGAMRLLNSTGTGAPTGFVHRSMNGLITTYLEETGFVIPSGFQVGDLYDAGDFWARNTGAAVTPGMKAFAVLATGAVSFATAGATVAGAVETNFYAATAGAAGELIKMCTIAQV